NPGEVAPRAGDNGLREKMSHAMEPEKFGGTFAGAHALTIDTLLPEIPLGGARITYNQISVFADGMTIGGTVKLPPDQKRKTLHPSVKPFGQPHRLEFCSMAAQTGNSSKNGF